MLKIKSLFFFVILLLLLTDTFYSQQFDWKALRFAPSAARHDDMHFITPDLGWIVNSSGQIYKTSDGGKNWTKQFQSSVYFRSLKFADSLRGWAGTIDEDKVLYHTNDGGLNWNLITNIPDPKPKRICGLAVPNDSVIYGSGAFDGPAIIIKSTDGGQTWESIDMSQYAGNLIDIYFLNSDSGFVVGGTPAKQILFDTMPIVLFTGDGGKTWEVRYSGNNVGEWGWKIVFPTKNISYVSLENLNEARIIKTIDGGNTWSEIPVNDLSDLEGIGFYSENIGWVAARQEEKITLDGGITWQQTDIGEQINRFQFFGDTLAYAAGVTIYKLTKSVVTDITDMKIINKNFFLLQNYPNPFNPSTNITFSLPNSANVRLKIYNGLGQSVKVLLNEFMHSGKHTVPWDGKDENGNIVSSGFYIYRIDAGNNAQSKMMILLK